MFITRFAARSLFTDQSEQTPSAWRTSLPGAIVLLMAVLLPLDALADEGWPGTSYTRQFNLTGWPGAVVRAGTSSDGLPIGVQLVAAPWREDIALALAGHIEAELGGWQPPAI